MKRIFAALLTGSTLFAALAICSGGAPAASLEAQPPHEWCPRPAPGSTVQDPEDLRSENGVLKVDLTMHDEKAPDGSLRFCYLLGTGNDAPTLRLKPGDLLILRLRNALTSAGGPTPQAGHAHGSAGRPAHEPGAGADPCNSGVMTLTSTNLHFHGLTLPPVCHQDDVLRTSIQPSDPPFEYRFRIPADEEPGLYWYHPHIHGFSSQQVLGGASGALIVEGLERSEPDLAGLRERVFVIRDRELLHPDATGAISGAASQALVDREGDAINTGTGEGKPAKDLSVNFVPIPYPDYTPAAVTMRPGERQLWRVLNASSVTYLDLAALTKRGPKFRPQWIGVVAIDGAALNGRGSPGHSIEWRNSMVVPPGARVEFIMEGPPAGAQTLLITRAVDTGPGGENDPNRPLLSITSSPDAPAPLAVIPAAGEPASAPALPWLGSVTPTRVRKLYFSEHLRDPNDPASADRFYLTVEGQPPTAFDPATTTPNVVVKQGDVEDWIIENRSSERHTFHIHEIHFQVIERLGLAVNEPFLRDTVDVPYYTDKMQRYPSVRLRMDFRDPNVVGTFVYHCHLLDHEDGGMMGLIRVEPRTPGPSEAGSALAPSVIPAPPRTEATPQ